MKQASKKPAIDIAGTGSLGGFFAHLLRRRGHDIRWLTQEPTRAPRRIELEGLEIPPAPLPLPELTVISYRNWSPVSGRVLLLASRADLTRDFLARLTEHPGPLPEVWVACNGIGLLDGLPFERFTSGLYRLLCGFGVRALTPGQYQFAGPGAAEWVRCQPPPEASESPANRPWILEALGEIGVHLSCAPTLQWAEWRKAAWNASMNAPLALAGLTNGALLEQPELHDTFIRLLNETVLIARAEGVDLDPNGQLQEQIESSIRATARNLNSMAAALAQGRPTEIDWINGAIVRRAAHHGISVPENQRLVNAVRARSLHGPR